MCCRAVDAHLGLIQEPVWELAERVVARLPNLKAVVFETMPEYFRSEGITSNEVASEIDRLRHLCDSRDSAVPEVKEATADRLPVETAGGDTAASEHTLGQVVGRSCVWRPNCRPARRSRHGHLSEARDLGANRRRHGQSSPDLPAADPRGWN